VRHDCPENLVADAGRDCIVYGLSGSQTRPAADSQPMQARLRLWVRPDDDGWEVNHYQYDLLLREGGSR
jgi:hypothetical protein